MNIQYPEPAEAVWTGAFGAVVGVVGGVVVGGVVPVVLVVSPFGAGPGVPMPLAGTVNPERRGRRVRTSASARPFP